MQIVVVTYRNHGEPSSRPIRVRPIAGQAFPESYRVWCSVRMRQSKPVGSLFLVNVSQVHQPHGESYLRIDLNQDWTPLSREEAEGLIAARTSN